MVDRAKTAANVNGSDNRWMLLAGAASLTAIAAGYLVYGYKSGWKGPAHSFWCPKRRVLQIKSPYYALIN